MSYSFNLVHQKFLPCRSVDGSFVELSLLDVFSEAHRVAAISDSSPLATAALHRLLLAILHRCFGPATVQDWADLWGVRKEGFPMETIRAYLLQWEHRFDLFDSSHPFYQTAGLQKWPKHSPISKLRPELASGNNATLFDHTCDHDANCFSPAEAARAVVSVQSFSACGTVSRERKEDCSADAAPLSSAAMVLIRGATLADTLLLNLHQYTGTEEEPFPMCGDDLPAWERNAEAQAEDRIPAGYLDLLTWQSRRIFLFPGTDQCGSTVVTGVVIMKGNQFPDDWPYRRREPMVAFQHAAKARTVRDAWLPISLRPGRAVWRDSDAFFQFQAKDELSTRPRLFAWLNRLIDNDALPNDSVFGFDVFGQATESGRASILLWRHEQLPLISAYLTEPVLGARLREALKIAEDSRFKLLSSARDVLKALGVGKATPHLSALEGRFWSMLELEFFPFFRSLPQDREVAQDGSVSFGNKELPDWTATVRRIALQCFLNFSVGLGATARVTIATAKAENQLRAKLPLHLKKDAAGAA